MSVSDVMSQVRSENFPVASRVLPRAIRHHLLAIYGFARLVDDMGDEAEGDRLAQLDWAEDELASAAAGTADASGVPDARADDRRTRAAARTVP